MGKDMKEKYERVCAIKDRAISLVESQINGNIENVDAKELGEVADIAKDMAELMKLCSEAEYYHSIVEAMEKNSDEENKKNMDKYLPESRYYDNTMDGRGRDNGMRNNPGNGRMRYYMPMTDYDEMYDWDDPAIMRRLGMKPHYYSDTNMNPGMNPNISSSMNGNNSNMNSNEYRRDSREGRAGITRRTYMEMKENGEDKQVKMKEMEKFLHDLADDMTEMIEGLDANEKATVKTKLTQLAAKIA